MSGMKARAHGICADSVSNCSRVVPKRGMLNAGAPNIGLRTQVIPPRGGGKELGGVSLE